jgi:hypothetical protein
MSDFKSLKAIRKQRAAPASFVARTTTAEASRGNDAQSSNKAGSKPEASAEGLGVDEYGAEKMPEAQKSAQVSRDFGSLKVLPEQQAGLGSVSQDERIESSGTELSSKALMGDVDVVEETKPEKQDYEGLYKVLPPSLEIRTSNETGRGLYSSILYKPGASDRTIFSAPSPELNFPFY